MMKSLISVVAMLLVAGCVSFVWAQQQGTPVQPTKPEHLTKEARVEKASALGGEIVSVDTTANTITLKYKSGKTETLKIDPKMTVKKAGKTIPLTDLSAGEKISVSYRTEAGKKIATSVIVKAILQNKMTTSKKKGTATAPK
jgi:hypothetical protein